MRLALIIVAATALASATPAVAEPRGLSLQEAQTLPAPVLAERVLGAVGALYTEVERPSPAIRRGRGFTISFATPSRSAGYPGLCEAETIMIIFGPGGDGPTTMMAHVQSVHRGNVYRIVGDTARPAGGYTDTYTEMLRARCAAAGPVFSAPGVAAPRFFGSGSAAEAWFAARVLAKASSAAATGALPVTCRDDPYRPGDPLCRDPQALLRNLPMERFIGFYIEQCAPNVRDLCVTASFSRTPAPGGSSIGIRIRTGLSETSYPLDDIPVREISIQDVTPIP